METTHHSVEAVLACYKKSLVWSNQLLLDKVVNKISIYDHASILECNRFVLSDSNYYYEEIPNKGCEASSYLKYIIDRYDSLPDVSILLHDEEYSWHHWGSICSLIKKKLPLMKTTDYLNLNHFQYQSDERFKSIPYFHTWYKQLLEPTLGALELFPNLLIGIYGCAQFILKKECILQHPRSFYENLYNFCMNDYDQFGYVVNGFGHFMELTFHIIFRQMLPLPKKMKGSWRKSSRYPIVKNNMIHAEFQTYFFTWNPVIFPIEMEEMIENKNGNACIVVKNKSISSSSSSSSSSSC